MLQPSPGGEADFIKWTEGIAAGEVAVEESFVRFFEPRIYTYVQRQVSHTEQVEEIVQDTLWTAIQALRANRLESAASLSSFVYGVARNKVADYRRKSARDRHAPWPENFDPPVRDAEASREHEAAAAIGELPDTERAVLTLILAEGLPTDAVAERLNLTADAVRQRKSRALRRIAERLRDAGSAGLTRLSRKSSGSDLS